MKVKIFDCEHEKDLENEINKLLNEVEVIDIKYQISTSVCGEEQIYCFSALVLYKEE